MKSIKDHRNLDDKYVLLRLDLNVPLNNGIVTDQTRIDKILPIINFLLSNNLVTKFSLFCNLYHLHFSQPDFHFHFHQFVFHTLLSHQNYV